MSLRARLLLAGIAVALVALVAADVATYAALRTFLQDQVRVSLDNARASLERTLVATLPPGEEAGSDTTQDRAAPSGSDADAPAKGPSGTGGGTSASLCSATAALAPGIFVEVRSTTGQVVNSDDCPAVTSGGIRYSPLLPDRITGLQPIGPSGASMAYFTAEASEAGGPEFEVQVSVLQAGSNAGDQLVLAQSLQEVDSTLARLVRIELAVTGAALVVAALLSWWLVGVGLRPLRRLEGTARAIARGELTERAPGATSRTEVGQVALAMNTMAENIEQAFAERDATEAELRTSEERLRQFVADASHELRTPVAVVSAYAELFERAERSREDLPRIMRGIASETRRMGRLVEDLLLLARLDEHRPVARDPVELVDLASGALETAHMVGPGWPVHLEATNAVEVLGDEAQLRQVLDNLLGNVRRHTPVGTRATVRVAEERGEAVLEVSDEGPGLAPDQVARVFERFYRADPSRARSSGGAGLGLSIVASIVEAHGGTVQVSSPGKGRGTTFTVRLPLRVPEEA